MKNYICVVFTKNDKIFCCRSIKNPDLWEFPNGEKEHHIVYESMMASLKEEILSEFDLSIGIHYPCDEKAGSIMSAKLSYVDTDDIKLANVRECIWITADEIDGIAWDPTFKPIANEVKDMLKKQSYRITELNSDGSEEIMWEDNCSEIEMEKQFHRVIHEQQILYREKKIKWRQIRVYNQFGDIIATES